MAGLADHLERADRREPRHRVVADHEIDAGERAREVGFLVDALPLDGIAGALHRIGHQPRVVGVVVGDQQLEGDHFASGPSVNSNRLPLPGCDVAETRPWWPSTMRRTLASPIPVPSKSSAECRR